MLRILRSVSTVLFAEFRLAGRIFSLLAAGLVALAGAGAALAQSTDDAAEAVVVEEYILGDPDAPVTMIEYASFSCPHCANFHTGPLKEIKKEYIDTGKVNLLYREVYFDRWGLWGAMVARCGGEARYFGIVELLYEQQNEWLSGSDAADVAENLRTIGRTAGLSTEELDLCLSDQALAEAMIVKYQENVTADDVQATPSFVIGGTTHRNMPLDEMRELLDAELAKQ